MRREEIEILSQSYTQPAGPERNRRFEASIGADIPSASRLAAEILSDLDTASYGIFWWTHLPVEERILISDYLYQCVDAIETNLAEAKLHYWEFLGAREKENRRTVDMLQRDDYGRIEFRMPPSLAAIDDLYKNLEELHLCGFFRAIGSSLDCLGAVIVGVLALQTSLRRADIGKAEDALRRITNPQNAGQLLQVDFRNFFDRAKSGFGPDGWLEWTNQYRNTYVHRGRRSIYNQIHPYDTGIVDANEQLIPRVTTTLHFPKYPDKSDAEAMILKNISLNEDADITLTGIFKSCRELNEHICERLINIWQVRRDNPTLLEQPISQWNRESKPCTFNGYHSSAPPIKADVWMSHPILHRRAEAAAVMEDDPPLWKGSRWSP